MSNNFGKRIRIRRLRQELRIEDLATRAGVSWRNLADIEAGVRFPSLRELERLLAALDVSLEDLLERRGTRTPD